MRLRRERFLVYLFSDDLIIIFFLFRYFLMKLLLLTYFAKGDQNAQVFQDILERNATLNYGDFSDGGITSFILPFHSEMNFSYWSENFYVFSI